MTSQLATLTVGPYTITFERRWAYWVISSKPAFPTALARELNDVPYNGPRSYYSGGKGTLGDVIRAEGFAGGQASIDIEAVGLWHIDTEEGLNAFTQWCIDKVKRDRP